MKKISKVLALVLVLVVSVCVLAGCGSPEDKAVKVVENFMDAMIDLDYERAVSYCYDSDLERQVDYAIEENGREWQTAEYVITSVEVDGDIIEVDVDVETERDEEVLYFELEEIDGDWFIVNIY